ncbi:MAG TPA: serine/threonine-protein kinase [Polyangiaceae bacterium]|jgi:serine/threonine-protein kinase|nr:serine/threonine-protein kinase [Polyangiaceae bacterium]
MPEPERFDGCEVVKRLSTGPITDLYHVVQEPLGRPAFLKALGSSILPSSPFAASLEREARLLAELDHANIPKVYDFVRRGERMWLVLEYVDGVSLADVMKKSRKLPEPFACAVALELCRALAHAHAHGVVHRDVEPKNVLLSKDGSVKLANFNVAFDERMPTAPELLEGGSGYGGPWYMSPEQILGERADGRSDLFSLGVLLYEMLSGERPFDGPDDRSTSLRIRRDPVPPLGKKAPGVSAALERVTQRCLEKMPSDRFDSSAEACAALESAARELGAEPTAPLVHDTLVRARLVDGKLEAELGTRRARPREGVGFAVSGLFFALALIVGGGATIQMLSGKSISSSVGAQAPGRRLELLPRGRAFLRVVAHPWAHVIVDGQEVEITPFARPIPLAVGSHYVRLEHPNAPVERRTIELSPGETLLLDVTLKVTQPKTADSATHENDAGVDDSGTP